MFQKKITGIFTSRGYKKFNSSSASFTFSSYDFASDDMAVFIQTIVLTDGTGNSNVKFKFVDRNTGNDYILTSYNFSNKTTLNIPTFPLINLYIEIEVTGNASVTQIEFMYFYNLFKIYPKNRSDFSTKTAGAVSTIINGTPVKLYTLTDKDRAFGFVLVPPGKVFALKDENGSFIASLRNNSLFSPRIAPIENYEKFGEIWLYNETAPGDTADLVYDVVLTSRFHFML